MRAPFVAANPRNNLRLEATYAAVERRVSEENNGSWVTVKDDRDWSLVFRWRRMNSVLAMSEVEISWEIEDETESGLYRLRYFGDSKTPFTGRISAFEGVSGEFLVR